MIPINRNNMYALTVVKEQDDWKLKYSIYNKKNVHDYEWCFSYHNNAFAIRWCGDSSTSGKYFVFYLDNDELKLTSYAAGTPLQPDHFINDFHST